MDADPDEIPLVLRIPAEEFEALLDELERPPKILPRLRELMQEARPFYHVPDDTDLDFAEQFMGNPANYEAVSKIPFRESHACVVTGCRLTQEEHHRIAKGMINELSDLRRRVRDLENGPRT